MTFARILSFIALLFFVFVLPWWLLLLFLGCAILLFGHYYEALIIALVFDLLYGAQLSFEDLTIFMFYTSNFFFTFISIILLFTAEEFKKRLTFY